MEMNLVPKRGTLLTELISSSKTLHKRQSVRTWLNMWAFCEYRCDLYLHNMSECNHFFRLFHLLLVLFRASSVDLVVVYRALAYGPQSHLRIIHRVKYPRYTNIKVVDRLQSDTVYHTLRFCELFSSKLLLQQHCLPGLNGSCSSANQP